MRRHSLFLLLTIFISYGQAQQMSLEVIPLTNRTADQLIDVIKPLLVPGGSVSGMNNKLIIKSTRINITEIKQLLNTLDKPLRRLLITVNQGQNINTIDLSQSVSGRVTSGDVSISNRSMTSHNQGVVISSTDSDGNRISYQAEHRETRTDNNHSFSVQTLEGQPALIQSGLSVPVQNQNTVFTRNGVIVRDSVEYVNATSGFYVLPRINGNQVTLMVAPNLTSVIGQVSPSFVVQNVQTTVSGLIGEWIDIGGLDTSTRANNRGILSGSENQQADSRTILIKVEEIR